MEDGIGQIAIAGGQLTVSVGVVAAAGAWLIKQWAKRYAENQELRRQNTELEREVVDQKVKSTEDALTKLRDLVSNHAKIFATITERMRRLESALEDQKKYTAHLTKLLENVMKLGTERVPVGKEAVLVRDKKPEGGESG